MNRRVRSVLILALFLLFIPLIFANNTTILNVSLNGSSVITNNSNESNVSTTVATINFSLNQTETNFISATSNRTYENLTPEVPVFVYENATYYFRINFTKFLYYNYSFYAFSRYNDSNGLLDQNKSYVGHRGRFFNITLTEVDTGLINNKSYLNVTSISYNPLIINVTENITPIVARNINKSQRDTYRLLRAIKNKYRRNLTENYTVEIDVPQRLLVDNNTRINSELRGKFRATMRFPKVPVESIEFNNLEINNDEIELGIENLTNDSFIQSYAIDPTKLVFDNATVRVVAKGDELLKCALWNFSEQRCDGDTVKIMNLTPGEEYTFILTPADPAFFENVVTTDDDARARDGVLQLGSVLRIGANNAGRIFDSYFRFQNVSVPPGAEIVNAYVNFTSTAGRSGVTVNTNIYGLDESNCNHFNSGNGGDNPVDNTRTGNFTVWDGIPAWTNLEQGPDTQTPNISNVIQEIVDISGWSYNNSLCVVVEDDGSTNNAFRDIATTSETSAQIFIDYNNPPASLAWNASSLSLEVTQGGNISTQARLSSIQANNNVTITKVGGTGTSFIHIDNTTVGDMADLATKDLTFYCSPGGAQSPGTFDGIFQADSNDASTPVNITISCTVTADPVLTITYPTSVINVTDGENLIINFTFQNKFEEYLVDSVDVIEIEVGGIQLNMTMFNTMTLNRTIDVSGEMSTPLGVTVYGDEMWVADNGADDVFHYYTNGTFIDQFEVASYTTSTRGIFTQDAETFWFGDNAGPNPDDTIVNTTADFNEIAAFDVSAQNTNPYGVTTDGSSIWMVGISGADTVYRYNFAGTFQDSFGVSGNDATSRGITTFNGTYLWVTGASADDIYRYTASGTLLDQIDMTGSTGDPGDLDTYGGHQFFVADNTNDRILVYEEIEAEYVGNHFIVNVTLPNGLAGLQNITLTVLGYDDDENLLTDQVTNVLSFPEKDPPATVTNLQNISRGTNWIYWNWTNPGDADYSHAEVWLNGTFLANVSAPSNAYNATGLSPGTTYDLGVRTVDINENINTTFVNDTAQTLTVPTVINVTPQSGFSVTINNNVTIFANVTDIVPITLVQAQIIWSSGSETIILDFNNTNQYNGQFNTTSTLGVYNVTIIATNINGGINNTETGEFEITTDTPFQDTFVLSNNPTATRGTNSVLRTDSSGNVRRILIQYDINYLPTGVQIDSAIMQLYEQSNSGGFTQNESVFANSMLWDESNATWNTQPTFINTVRNWTNIDGTEGYHNFNITSLVEEWYNGSLTNYGMLIREEPESTDGNKIFTSSNAASNNPLLFINYTDITNPDVENLVPVNGTTFEIHENVSLSAQVTDNVNVSAAYANVTWEAGNELIELVHQGSFIYLANFTNTSYVGRYNVTFIGNDTTNLINNTEETYFIINDSLPPTITDTRPIEDSTIDVNTTIEIAFNSTDNDGITDTYVNITLANGTTRQIPLLDTGAGDKFNTSYTIPFVKGQYILTFVSEDNQSNFNITFYNITITSPFELYNFYFGNTTDQVVLGRDQIIFRSFGQTQTKNIYATDSDNSVDWDSLQAIGRTSLGGVATNDFDELDELFNSSYYNVSIRDKFASDASTPLQTRTINVYGTNIANIPIADSTNVSSFITGILWDTTDDFGDNEFDVLDNEDVVFMTQINSSEVGYFGNYDYEIAIPESLGTQRGASSLINFYTEIE